MASLGGGRINPNPCTPEDAAANWQYLANNVINDIYNTFDTITAGSSDHKVSRDAGDEAAHGQGYLAAKFTNADAFVSGDVEVYRDTDAGDGTTVHLFVKQADVTGGGSSDHKFSVDSSDVAPNYFINKAANVDTYDAAVHRLVSFQQVSHATFRAFVEVDDFATAAIVVAEGTYTDVSLAGNTYTVNVDVTEIAGYNAAKDQVLWHNTSGTFAWIETANYDSATAQVFNHTNLGVWRWDTIAALLNSLSGYDSTKDQSIGHDAHGATEWQDDGAC